MAYLFATFEMIRRELELKCIPQLFLRDHCWGCARKVLAISFSRGSTIGVLKSRFPAFFSSYSRHPALFYARIPVSYTHLTLPTSDLV